MISHVLDRRDERGKRKRLHSAHGDDVKRAPAKKEHTRATDGGRNLRNEQNLIREFLIEG